MNNRERERRRAREINSLLASTQMSTQEKSNFTDKSKQRTYRAPSSRSLKLNSNDFSLQLIRYRLLFFAANLMGFPGAHWLVLIMFNKISREPLLNCQQG